VRNSVVHSPSSVIRDPDHVAVFKGPTSKGRTGEKGEGREMRGGKGMDQAPKYFGLEPPLQLDLVGGSKEMGKGRAKERQRE